MIDDNGAALEVGFQIDFGDAFGNLRSLDDILGEAAAQAVREFQKMEQASKGAIDLSGATAQIRSFAGTASRELRLVTLETNRIEAAGEKLVRQLENQNSAFGRSRDTLLGMKVETAALAAEQKGMTELAGRLRAEYTILVGQQNAAAEASAREAQAIRDAAHGYNLFETAARKGMEALREQQALDAAAARLTAEAERRAEAERLVNNQLAERAKIEAALERTTGLGRTSARDNGATFSALAARALEDEAQALRDAAFAHGQFELAAARGSKAMRDEAEAARQAQAAATAQAAAVDSLRGAVDPLHGQQQRLNRELENAARLYRAGAIGQDEYERSSTSLAAKLENVRRAQADQSREQEANRKKLGSSDVANIFAQVSDIGVSLAGGQNPFLVLIQQGSQLQGIMMQTGATFGDMVRAVGALFIVTTPTAAATAALAEAELALAAAQTAATGANARAAITAAELAVAEEAAAAAGLHDASAHQLAATARLEAAAAAEVAAAAARQLAAAEAAAGAATTGAAQSATRSLVPWLARLGPIGLAAGAAAAGIALLAHEANEGAGMKAYAASLGLTAKEIRHLDDVSVTFGDTAKAVFQVAGAAIWSGVGGPVTATWKWMKEWLDWLAGAAKQSVNFMIGHFVAGYNTIRATWSQLPAAMGDAFYTMVNAAIGGINALIRKSVEGINGFITTANGVLGKVGLELPKLSVGEIAEVANQYAGAGKKVAGAFTAELAKVSGKDFVGAGVALIADQARKNAEKRIREDAEKRGYLDPDKAKKPKVDKHAEQLAREAAATEAQIRNLYALADAYGVSGAAALIAEARVKAESAAIKKRADIEEAVARQVRLAVAQRVSDSAKAAAGMRDEAALQEMINAGVANGTIVAEQANELLRDRIADLPLLAALEAARTVKDVKGIEEATKALEVQRSSRDRLTDAQRRGQLLSAMSTGDNRLAELQEELRLVGATEEVRVRALATLRATQEATAKGWAGADGVKYIQQQADIAVGQVRLSQAQDDYNDSLSATADLFDLIDNGAQRAASGIADAFGNAGAAIGDVLTTMTGYYANQARLEQQHKASITAAGKNQARIDRENYRFAMQSSSAQIGMYGDMAGAAKGFFKEGTTGYKALQTAETIYRVAQMAMSISAMFQNTAETVTSVSNAGARAAADGAAGIAAQSKLPFPANLAAMAATAAALAAVGITIAGALGGGGKGNTLPAANTGTGTVLGDSKAQSESIKRAVDQLKEVDTVTNTFARQMAGSLRSIDNQIGRVASVIVRSGNVNADAGVNEGFKANAVGSVLGAVPLIGGILKGLFGTSTTVLASGLYGGAQSIGDIMAGGFDASTYSDVQKKKKLFGITTSTKYSTQYGALDGSIEQQFTLLLKSFSDSIASAAVPLGQSTDAIEARLNGFVVNIGKIDLKGLTGTEIQEKLEAVFGAAADGMAGAAFPGIERFQKVGEGAFETLVRVASTAEAVTNALSQMGDAATKMSLDAKVALADQFDTVGDLTNAIGSYFEAFYTPAEQSAARVAELTRVFTSMGLSMPSTLAGFRQLVEAQDLNTSAGQAAYATLLKLAPAFADLQEKMSGAKSAADVAAERQDLERQLLELRGDTAALRALELAKLDASNRALQEQIYAIQDAQEAAKAADELRKAWSSVGDTIMDEVRRIRDLTATEQGGFAGLQGQFNVAVAAARGGDLDAAKMLPQLSQALLAAAADAATSRQELDRVRAQTASQLEAVSSSIAATGTSTSLLSDAALLSRASTAQDATMGAPANDDDADEDLRAEVSGLRRDLTAALATIAGNTGRIDKRLERVTEASGGDAVTIAGAAA